MLTIKVDQQSGCTVLPGALVKRGEVLGLSPFFDHLILSPVDGLVEEIRPSSREPVMLVTITPLPLILRGPFRGSPASAEVMRSGRKS